MEIASVTSFGTFDLKQNEHAKYKIEAANAQCVLPGISVAGRKSWRPDPEEFPGTHSHVEKNEAGSTDIIGSSVSCVVLENQCRFQGLSMLTANKIPFRLVQSSRQKTLDSGWHFCEQGDNAQLKRLWQLREYCMHGEAVKKAISSEEITFNAKTIEFTEKFLSAKD